MAIAFIRWASISARDSRSTATATPRPSKVWEPGTGSGHSPSVTSLTGRRSRHTARGREQRDQDRQGHQTREHAIFRPPAPKVTKDNGPIEPLARDVGSTIPWAAVTPSLSFPGAGAGQDPASVPARLRLRDAPRAQPARSSRGTLPGDTADSEISPQGRPRGPGCKGAELHTLVMAHVTWISERWTHAVTVPDARRPC